MPTSTSNPQQFYLSYLSFPDTFSSLFTSTSTLQQQQQQDETPNESYHTRNKESFVDDQAIFNSRTMSIIDTSTFDDDPKARVRFDLSQNVVYDTFHHSSLTNHERDAMWLTNDDWDRIRIDFVIARKKCCPSVQRHQPDIASRRKATIAYSQQIVFHQQRQNRLQQRHQQQNQHESNSTESNDADERIAKVYIAATKSVNDDAHLTGWTDEESEFRDCSDKFRSQSMNTAVEGCHEQKQHQQSNQLVGVPSTTNTTTAPTHGMGSQASSHQLVLQQHRCRRTKREKDISDSLLCRKEPTTPVSSYLRPPRLSGVFRRCCGMKRTKTKKYIGNSNNNEDLDRTQRQCHRQKTVVAAMA